MLDVRPVSVVKPAPCVGDEVDKSTDDTVVKSDGEAPADVIVLTLIVPLDPALAEMTIDKFVGPDMVSDAVRPAVNVVPLCPIVTAAIGKAVAIEVLNEFEAGLDGVTG